MRADSAFSISYRYFAAVAETGSVRAASRMLNVAASAISRQLIQLEHMMGVDLFERHGRQLRLTAAGEILLRGLRTSEREHESTLADIAALKGLKRGKIKIATVESVSQTILPDIVSVFSQSYPGLQFSITVQGSDAVTEMVRETHADVGFTFNPSSRDGIEVAFERKFPMGAVVAPGHPLSKRKSLSLGECLEYPVAWPAQGLSLRAILDRSLGKRATSAMFLIECNSLRLMASLARQGRCVAFQTPIGIETDLLTRRLVFIPLNDRALPSDRLMLVFRPALQKHSAAGVFVEEARRHIATLSGE